MPRSRALLGLVVGLVAALTACAAEIRITGSDLIGPGLKTVLETFARENDVHIVQRFQGSRPGFDQLRSGDADLGLFVLAPGETLPVDPYISRVIAYHPVIFVVPTANPLKELTAAQVRGIFAATGGENLSNWGELGLTAEWRTRAISVQAVDQREALTVQLLRRLALEGAELKALTGSASLARVLERVKSSDNAIGLVPLVPAPDSGLRPLAFAASVKDSAHLPTSENLHDGSYPLRVPLYVVFRREAAPRLLVLLRHLLSDECGEVLARAAFVPLPVGPRNQLVFELEELN